MSGKPPRNLEAFIKSRLLTLARVQREEFQSVLTRLPFGLARLIGPRAILIYWASAARKLEQSVKSFKPSASSL